MSDSFNPQELLSKLRAKSNNSTAASMSSSIVSEQPSKCTTSANVAESEHKANTPTKVQATKNIRAPISLTLTPSQRQENLNARLELEREIKRLQDEVAFLSTENLQLKKDKEDVEQQFMEFRARNEDIVVKLRGKIAAQAMNNSENQTGDRGSGAGRLYGPPHRSGELISKYPTPHNYSACGSRSPTSSAKKSPRYMATPQSAQHGQQQGYHSGEGEGGSGAHHLPPPPPAPPLGGFRDPTFSELMRRSTPDHVEFREALRRNGTTRLGTGLGPNPAAPNSNPHHPHSHSGVHPGAHPGGHPSGHVQQHHQQQHSQQQHQHQPHQQYQQQHQQGVGQSGGGGPAPANYVAHGGSSSSTQNNSNPNTPTANHPVSNNISANHRTKSLPNVLNSPHLDMPQQESSRGNNNNIGYGDSHRQNSISNYAEKDQFLGNSSFKHSGHHGPLEHSSLNVPHGSNSNSGGNTHGHSSHHSQHNSHHHHGSSSSNHADYLSAGDTSDGEDIPVLEIDLSA